MSLQRDLVLVVDDDPDARTMLERALGGAGFAVSSAPDAERALAAALANHPDLVVMDALMPGASGFEACRWFKARPELAHVPIVFMTGLSESEHVVEGFRAGGVDYVSKPVVLDELIARIQVHLANARMALSARFALDVAGRSLLATDGGGRVLWRTPQAERLLGALTGSGAAEEPAELGEAMRRLAIDPRGAGLAAQTLIFDGRALRLAYLGRAGDQRFFRLAEPIEGREGAILRDALGLTARESDVLFWVSRGKSNRDVSEILNISARTVNKHLEQVFTKLGVENRAAAAAIATRIVAAYS